MKKKHIPILDSALVVKSTANLREEIINELIKPDKNLNSLLKDINEDETKNERSFCDRRSNPK